MGKWVSIYVPAHATDNEERKEQQNNKSAKLSS